MIIDLHEKIDVDPQWFADQSQRNGWAEWLCQLLSMYKVKDEDGAKKAAELMIAAGINEELVKVAME